MIYQVLSGARQLSDKAEYRLAQAERAAGIGASRHAVEMSEPAPENAYPTKPSMPMILREPVVPAVGTSEGANLQALEKGLAEMAQQVQALAAQMAAMQRTISEWRKRNPRAGG